MQGGELDGDAGIVVNAGARRMVGNGADRPGIGEKIAARIGLRHRRLAEHVEGKAVAGLSVLGAAPDGVVNGAAEDELLAKHAHRLGDGGAHERLADTLDQIAQIADKLGFGDCAAAEYATGQHQRPGRGIDQERPGLAGVPAPVGATDLVADQRVERRCVGHAQIGFGQAHQRDALVGGQAVFGQEGVHQAGRGIGAQPADHVFGLADDAGARRLRQAGCLDHLADNVLLAGEIGLADGVAYLIEIHRMTPLFCLPARC